MPTRKKTTAEANAADMMKPVPVENNKVDDYDAEKRRLLKQIDNLKKQIDNMEKYKMYKNMGDEFQLMLNGYIDSGFSRAEAFELLKLSVTAATNMNKR